MAVEVHGDQRATPTRHAGLERHRGRAGVREHPSQPRMRSATTEEALQPGHRRRGISDAVPDDRDALGADGLGEAERVGLRPERVLGAREHRSGLLDHDRRLAGLVARERHGHQVRVGAPSRLARHRPQVVEVAGRARTCTGARAERLDPLGHRCIPIMST